jgi:hypothetical protein
MFTETIFKPNFVAVREIGAANADSMIVSIYEKISHSGAPELWNTALRMVRPMDGQMAAMIRHSTNWINKLEREYRTDYWNEEIQEWRAPSTVPRFFLNQPHDHLSFLNRMQALSMRAGTSPSTPHIPVDRVIRSLQSALDTAIPAGTINRAAVIHRFIEGIRP